MTRSPLIQLQDVVKTLGANRVLDGVNLSIYRGEITAIIGKSGSGKSVLLKHVIGLLRARRGGDPVRRQAACGDDPGRT